MDTKIYWGYKITLDSDLFKAWRFIYDNDCKPEDQKKVICNAMKILGMNSDIDRVKGYKIDKYGLFDFMLKFLKITYPTIDMSLTYKKYTYSCMIGVCINDMSLKECNDVCNVNTLHTAIKWLGLDMTNVMEPKILYICK